MAKKKKFKLPADSKSFIAGLVAPKEPVAFDETDARIDKENANLIQIFSSIDMMIEMVGHTCKALDTISRYDHMQVQDPETHRAWLFNTYIGPTMRNAAVVHQRHIVNPDYVEPECEEVAAKEDASHKKEMERVKNEDHTFKFLIKHMVNKEPFIPLERGDDISKEDNLLVVEYNAVSTQCYYIMKAASLVYRLLKMDGYGVNIKPSELESAKVFLEKPVSERSLMALSFFGYYLDMYMYLCEKLGKKPINIKKALFASRLHHQAARAAIGMSNHKTMCTTLAYFWTCAMWVLEKMKEEFPALIDKHHSEKIVLFPDAVN